MLIVAYHVVHDRATFWRAAAEAPIPPHLKLHHVLPSKDGATGVCLWEADSVEVLTEFIEPALGTVSTNEYFPVHEQNARVLSLAGIVGADALGDWRNTIEHARPLPTAPVVADAPMSTSGEERGSGSELSA